MQYKVVPITPQLLAGVWDDLWERGAEEFRRIGISPNEALCACVGFAQNAVDSVILLADDKPVLVAGICPDEGGAFTWMQATKDFDQHALAIIRLLRNRIRAYTGPLYLYSTLVHPASAKFYHVLGFAPDDWQGKTPAGAALYRFKRR